MLQDIFNLQNITSDSFYWFCALVGSGMFVIQFFLNLIGLGDQESIDEGGIADAGKFKWLSRQALTGFLMMFGWTALTCQKEFGIEGFSGMSIALLSGVLAIFATGFLFKMAKKLHSNGSVFAIEDTVGQEAVVYQRIPHNGVGKISVSIQNFNREIDACSNSNQDILSFTRVKIIKKMNNKTVIVETL